jgi:hypothetical protein
VKTTVLILVVFLLVACDHKSESGVVAWIKPKPVSAHRKAYCRSQMTWMDHDHCKTIPGSEEYHGTVITGFCNLIPPTEDEIKRCEQSKQDDFFCGSSDSPGMHEDQCFDNNTEPSR